MQKSQSKCTKICKKIEKIIIFLCIYSVIFAFLSDLLDIEWNHAEKNGGMTFMGKTIKGVTKAITSAQNALLYGDKNEKN